MKTHSKSADFDDDDKIFGALERMYIESLIDNIIKEKIPSTQGESDQNSSAAEPVSRECFKLLQIGGADGENEERKIVPEIDRKKYGKDLLHFKSALRNMRESFSAFKAQTEKVLAEERLKLNFGMEKLLENGLKKFLSQRKKIAIEEIKRVHWQQMKERKKEIKKESELTSRISGLFQGLKASKKVKQEAAKASEEKMEVEFTILEEVPLEKAIELQKMQEEASAAQRSKQSQVSEQGSHTKPTQLQTQESVGQHPALTQESKTHMSIEQSPQQKQIEQKTALSEPVKEKTKQKPGPKPSKKTAAKQESKIAEPLIQEPLSKTASQNQLTPQSSQPKEADAKQTQQRSIGKEEQKETEQIIPSKPATNTKKVIKKEAKSEIKTTKPSEKNVPSQSQSTETSQKGETDRGFAKPQLSQQSKVSSLTNINPFSDILKPKETRKVPNYLIRNHDPKAELPQEIVKDLKRVIEEAALRQQKDKQQHINRNFMATGPEYFQRGETQMQKPKSQQTQNTQKQPPKGKDPRSAVLIRSASGTELNLSASNSNISSVINEESRDFKPSDKQMKSTTNNSNKKEEIKMLPQKSESKEPFEIQDDSDSPPFEIIGSPVSEHVIESKPKETEKKPNTQASGKASTRTTRMKDNAGKQESSVEKGTPKKKTRRKPTQNYREEDSSDEEEEPIQTRTRSARAKKMDEEFSVSKSQASASNTKTATPSHPMLQKKREARSAVRYDGVYS